MTHLDSELKTKILPDKSIKESYLNYMKYAYKNKETRKYVEKPSTRRKTLKKYKI